jgi:hypothetical protein
LSLQLSEKFANETTIQLDPPPLPPPIQYNTSLEDNTIISQPQETATSEPLPASSSNPYHLLQKR